MKIKSIEAMVLKAPVPEIETWRAASFAMPFEFAETTLVRLTTEDGTVGWGEVHAPVAPEVTKSAIDVLIAPALIGASVLGPAVLWDKMHALMRPRGHALGFMQEAISGVDIAVWDALGKVLGQPVCNLLGGRQQQDLRTYASVLHWLEPGDLAETARRHQAAGFTAMKIKVGQDRAIDRRKAEETRAAVGAGFTLLADANCRYSTAEAIEMARVLEDHGYEWLEEPVPPEDVSGYVHLRSRVDIAIAGGECECTHYRFADLIGRGAFDVLQPDVCRAGGITACHRIGALASAHNLRIAPHVSIGSAIHVAASLHWALSESTAFIHEYPVFPNPLVDDLFQEPLDWRDGRLHASDAPGLGFAVREDVVEKYRVA